MRIKTDFHVHTELSLDADTTLDATIERAIAIGLNEIAITDHADHNPSDIGAGKYDPQQAYEATCRAMARYGKKIIIRHGVEMDMPHLYTRENEPIYKLPLDVVIGSVHYVGSHGVHADLFDVMTRDEAVGKQFEAMLDMVQQSDIDVLGHLDYFERYTRRRGWPSYQPQQFRTLIEPILETIIRRDIALEVNSSGLRCECDMSHPHPTIIRWYRQMGGRLISLGSDSHRTDHVGAGLDRCAELLISLGFSEYHIYHRRRCRTVGLPG